MSQMGKNLPKIKKYPYGAIYQKFNPKILVLEISQLPLTHQIGSKVSTNIPFAHLRLCRS
jgi:hypothetical protein